MWVWRICMLTGKRGMLFDLDGTLIDSMWMWKAIDIEYLGLYGIELPKGLQRKIEGMSFSETAVYFKEQFQIPDSLDKIKSTWNEMAYDKYKNEVPLKEGVLDFLKYCKKQGIKTAICTSNSRELASVCLESLGIDQYIDLLVTACDVNKGKPSPDIYLTAAKKLSLTPEECLVFEDIVKGLQAGISAGMDTCAVEDKYSEETEAEKRKHARYYVRSFHEVMLGSFERIV